MEPSTQPAGNAPADDSRALHVVTACLLALAIGFCWLPRLRFGLSLDETFSAWQAEGGWALARTRLENPGQTPLFGYIEALVYHPGTSFMEIALRMPAVIGALASAFFLWRLAEELVGRGAGFAAVVPFFCNLFVIRSACEARPYMLATAACLASLWSLRRWLDDGRRRHLVAFAVSSALVVHLHLVFVAFFSVPAVLIAAHVRSGRAVDWRGLAMAVALSALLVAPLVPFIRDFVHRSAGLSFMPVPGARRLFEVLLPFTVLISALGVAVLSIGRRRSQVDAPLSPSVIVVLVAWLLLPPLCLFLVSRVTGKTVLNERYLVYTVAAQSLVVAALYRRFPAELPRVALLTCFLPIPIFLGVSDWKRADGQTSYRAPMEAVRAIDPTGAAPLFLQAGHPLSNDADWQQAVSRGSFIYSPLTAYPLPNRVFPLPYALDETAKSFVRAAADGSLRGADVILFVGEPKLAMTTWLDSFFEARGYAATFEARGGIRLLVLRRQTAVR
jgi:hypothetical protein